MKTHLLAALASILAAAPVIRATAAETNFFDGTFNSTDWTATVAVGLDNQIVASQIPNGGNPDYYRKITHHNFTDNVIDFHFRQGAIYFPSNIPNASIDFSIDEVAIAAFNGIGIAFVPLLRQDGTNYWGPGGLNNTSAWLTYAFGNLRAADFDNFVATSPPGFRGSIHPDFSANGSAIQLGFATANDNGGFPGSRSAGFDNWTIIVHQGPVLTNLTVLGNSQVQMQLLTWVGHSDTLQSSTDLSNWNTILVTNAVSTNIVTLVDPNSAANSVARFYRVMDTFP
jgi:hypothetical protein